MLLGTGPLGYGALADIPASQAGPVVVPYNQYYWPNPVLRQRSGLSWINSLRIQLLRPFSQTNWPNPYRAPYSFRADCYESYAPLLSSIQPPNNQEDWPVPKRPQWPQPWVPQSNVALLSFVTVPFSQTDWPIPRRSQWPQSQSYPSNINLQFPETVLPFNQYDWPQPIRSKYPVAGPTSSLSFVIATPFNQTDWPQPQRSKYPVAGPYSSNMDLYFVDVPFNQYDWPIPKKPQWPQPWIPQSNVSLLSFIATPYNQYDWPIPRLPKQPIVQHPNRNVNLYFPETVLPFNQTDWPIPRIAAQPQKPLFKSDIGALSFVAAQMPYNQYYWPGPIPTWKPLYGYIGFYNPFYLNTGAKPFAQLAWPIPRKPSAPGMFWTTRRPPVRLEPFNQYNWPNPRGIIYPTNLRGFTQYKQIPTQAFFPRSFGYIIG
jgi:hypothetical protein